MTVDRYTKGVLTVIAACLVWISFGGPSLVTPVSAQLTETRVTLTGWMDNRGTIRPFPSANWAGAPKPGAPIAPAPLPVWDVPSNRNP